ncbi:hypothetical protein [Muricoccus vinaceus]|uniref:hypothetical protein n=1 Tax=Muricoccus vinaceus TaxID=424704 RepID=UPI003671C5B8
MRYFDAYSLKARVFPALIAGLPSFAMLLMMVKWDNLGLSNLIVSATSMLLLYALSDLARKMGTSLEKKLGSRATPHLWRRDNDTIDEVSKRRYREYIARQIKAVAPTEEDELRTPEEARAFYLSAGNWLRSQTRDQKQFRILFDDLISYGFRRNLRGLKYVGLVANAVVLSICLWILLGSETYFESIPQIQQKALSIVAVVIIHSIYLGVAVNRQSVLNASETYGKQLILDCDILIKRSENNTSKPRPTRAAKFSSSSDDEKRL